ncbi:TIGR02328 family protein [Paludicola sp. MB14-C6]|uniref:TIGR02328 family protein n=1 Tax=Paludihabitans sp. MB14-C6 TaxID=3070656 RepID=UPI0027DE3B9F|nr:TIGR02328 family protein [Paludicola sp. MB14-C6]WMJ21926.1 TIGR02328 family protein [Paludicola sp. MB14-C6]
MRLWHQSLLSQLPSKQLLGQHRECCALRGNGWGKKHSVVDYVFTHEPELLVAYHHTVMLEMKKRGYHIDPLWWDYCYRGKNCAALSSFSLKRYHSVLKQPLIYDEHNPTYYEECISNLKEKGITIE